MSKIKSVFFCSNCGHDAPKWMGKCPSCGEWNTFVEEKVQSAKGQSRQPSVNKDEKAVNIQEVSRSDFGRFSTTSAELDRVLGGGIVSGSLILLGGEPGIGKSTLLLQVALKLNKKILYISGEESLQQISLRADRIGILNSSCFLFADAQLQSVMHQIEALKPDLVIVDSVQTLYSELIDSVPGSITQIRDCTGALMRFAKTAQTPVILIGHITKDGAIAGPKVLEHMVDVVLNFEGDRHHLFRMLRCTKNRFGATHELGIYEMNAQGLREVQNPSEILLANRTEQMSGTAVCAALEGVRPFLIEIQALVSSAVYGTPQRSATSYDLRRLSMLLAVLEKRCGFRLGAKDVFLNVAGGLRIDDTATDLAVIAAILSSGEDIALSGNDVFAGEVGLSGEIRPVQRIEQRLLEAQKLGFERFFYPGYAKLQQKDFKIELIPVKKVDTLFKHLFG
jgi:DNA repair protein RadA/Sms